MVQHRDELVLLGWVQDVVWDFELTYQQIHKEAAQLNDQHVWPGCLITQEGGASRMLLLQSAPLLPRQHIAGLGLHRT